MLKNYYILKINEMTKKKCQKCYDIFEKWHEKCQKCLEESFFLSTIKNNKVPFWTFFVYKRRTRKVRMSQLQKNKFEIR